MNTYGEQGNREDSRVERADGKAVGSGGGGGVN